MFRISSNWRTGELIMSLAPPCLSNASCAGRCSVERLHPEPEPIRSIPHPVEHYARGAHILLAGSLTITTTKTQSAYPELLLVSPSHDIHLLSCQTPRSQATTFITALTLDQSPPAHAHFVRLAVFLSTGEFVIFSVNHHRPTQSIRQLAYLPAASIPRTTSIIQAAFHGQLLATLSQSFHLSLYDLSSDSITHKQTLTSFTSHPPSSLVLTLAGDSTYKFIIAYAVPVFPAHWSVGATELIISILPSLVVSSSRTTRTYDVPSGWIDEYKLRLMREQWGRKVARVADTQTDGKWVVLAPGDALLAADTGTTSDDDSDSSSERSSSSSSFVASRLHSPSSLQLYRLYLPSGSSAPKLTYVRSLHGQIGPVAALALADGRCVSLGENGSIWVWDLEAGTGAEVFIGSSPVDENSAEAGIPVTKGHIVFDERRIVTADARGVEVRRFDI